MNSKQSAVTVPKALRVWFVVHFIADVIAALPLFIRPDILGMLGWESVDPYTTRLVAAALFGIGIESWLGRNAEAEIFKNMLNLKIIWSATAVIGILISVFQGAQGVPPVALAVLAIFFAFHCLWVYWRIVIGRLLKNRLSEG